MFAQQVVNGLMLGSVYALIGVGFTLIFGVLRMLNLAHAYIFMASPFAAFALMSVGFNAFLAMVGALGIAGILGVALYFIAFKNIPQQDALAGFVTSLSFGIIIQVIVVNAFGTLEKSFTIPFVLSDLTLGAVLLSGMQLTALLLSLLIMSGLFYLISWTRFGRNVRAVAENTRAASLMGVPVERTKLQVFSLASALAGIAGLLVAVRFQSISALMSDVFGLKALAIIVIGGLGDLRGALVAGLFLGICEVLFQAYFAPGWSEAFIWLALIGTLVAAPNGIFGTRYKAREI